MHATVCLLCAGQLGSVGHAAKSGQFKEQFSLVKYDPKDVNGLSVEEINVFKINYDNSEIIRVPLAFACSLLSLSIFFVSFCSLPKDSLADVFFS